MRAWILGVAVAALPLTAAADEVFLKSGGQLSGRVVSRTATMIEVDVGAGRITVPTSSVVRIEEGRSALQEYEERAAKLSLMDAKAWIALGDWASAQGLGTQARDAYSRALYASPDDPRANEALGNVQVNGRWVSEEEGYRARGYVKFEGDWITPAEHEAILRERVSSAQQESALRQAEVAEREAEARAREAEARAREAEAQAAEAQETSEGLPLWYGWGVGPISWRTTPAVTHPIGPRPPAGVPR